MLKHAERRLTRPRPLPVRLEFLAECAVTDHWLIVWPIASYCVSSIIMTVVNKVRLLGFPVSGSKLAHLCCCPAQLAVSGSKFNMTCVLLFIQCTVCACLVILCKRLRIISVRDFDLDIARKWFPISSFLVILIYTGSKSLVSSMRCAVPFVDQLFQQYLSIPVYTIFKNLTIILIVSRLLSNGEVSNTAYRPMESSFSSVDA